jgi:hypothetical protein
MVRGIRRFISVGVVICALAVTIVASGDKRTSQSSRNLHAANPEVTANLIEVRIRRLHLVRPDLIPYPIAYEIIC